MGLPTSNTNTPGMLMQARKVNCVFVCMFHACVLSRHCVFVCVYRCALDPFGQLTTHTHKYTHTSGQLLNKLFLWMIPPRNGAGAQAGQGGPSSACFSTHVIHKPKRRELADKFDSLIYRFQTYLYVLVFWFHHHRLLSFQMPLVFPSALQPCSCCRGLTDEVMSNGSNQHLEKWKFLVKSCVALCANYALYSNASKLRNYGSFAQRVIQYHPVLHFTSLCYTAVWSKI